MQRGKKINTDPIADYNVFKDSQYDMLAKGLRESLDMERIYEIMGVDR